MFCDAQHLDVETLILLETDLHFTASFSELVWIEGGLDD